ncbi:MAG: class I SAM-dependent methyltransferase [Coriobacteriales bacterium]
MDIETARILNALTSDFYARCTASFAATRTRPWHGWERCLEVLDGVLAKPELSVLDFGCGNLRFENFLRRHANARMDVYAVDSCPELLDSRQSIHFINLDIVSALWDDKLEDTLIDVPACDLACAFGLMHHIPGNEAREALLDAMLSEVQPAGYLLVSFWQFERDERLACKAQKTTQAALERYSNLQLDEGDWFLGWQDESDVLRYCHNFPDAEIDELIEHVSGQAHLIDRFNADGPNDNMNCYLVLKRL